MNHVKSTYLSPYAHRHTVVLRAFNFPSHKKHCEIGVQVRAIHCKYTWRMYADMLLKYFGAGPSGHLEDKWFPCCPIISFVRVVCYMSHAARNDPRLSVVVI